LAVAVADIDADVVVVVVAIDVAVADFVADVVADVVATVLRVLIVCLGLSLTFLFAICLCYVSKLTTNNSKLAWIAIWLLNISCQQQRKFRRC
jgi:hypothetical protein